MWTKEDGLRNQVQAPHNEKIIPVLLLKEISDSYQVK